MDEKKKLDKINESQYSSEELSDQVDLKLQTFSTFAVDNEVSKALQDSKISFDEQSAKPRGIEIRKRGNVPSTSHSLRESNCFKFPNSPNDQNREKTEKSSISNQNENAEENAESVEVNKLLFFN